jgi:hypothetical protein
MARCELAIAAVALFVSLAHAQPQSQGGAASQPAGQGRLVNAYGQSFADYGQCVRATGNFNRCGASPEATQSMQQRNPGQLDVRVTDYYCVERYIGGGQPWANAMQACTRYQPQQSIGGYGQSFPDATERDILDAQAGAINAFSACVKAAAPGTYCGPPP